MGALTDHAITASNIQAGTDDRHILVVPPPPPPPFVAAAGSSQVTPLSGKMS